MKSFRRIVLSVLVLSLLLALTACGGGTGSQPAAKTDSQPAAKAESSGAAYTWGGGASGHTSIGLWPKRGIVAVDPRVIPYYTKLYIPGYGMAIAGDTGGAIVGTRIDLFMDSLHECFQWGRRDVEIYILE